MSTPSQLASTQPNQQNYAVAVGTSGNSVAFPILLSSAPNANTIGPPYPLGKRAIVPTANEEYCLTSFSSTSGVLQANWQVSASPSQLLSTLTGDSGGAVSPSSGNISILGTAAQVSVVGSTSLHKLTISLIGPYTPATYTAHGVLIGEGASSIVATTAGTTGQVLIGSTSADPAFGALGVNSGLTGLIVGNTNSAFTAATYTAATAFTPAFSLATPGDSAWTYSSRIGRYTQIGAVVYFTAQLVWSAFTNATGSGNWQVSLPVASGVFTQTGQVAISGSGIDASAETANLPANFLGVIGSGASVVVLSVEEGGTGNAASALFSLTLSQVKTTGTLNISGWYFAA